jgi:hypothetical protein
MEWMDWMSPAKVAVTVRLSGVTEASQPEAGRLRLGVGQHELARRRSLGLPSCFWKALSLIGIAQHGTRLAASTGPDLGAHRSKLDPRSFKLGLPVHVIWAGIMSQESDEAQPGLAEPPRIEDSD